MTSFVCTFCQHEFDLEPDEDGLFAGGYINPPCPNCGAPSLDASNFGMFECKDCGNTWKVYGNGGLHFGMIPSCPACSSSNVVEC